MATFASVTAAVGSGYWWESDWTVYIDDGQGERRPFDEFTGWWQAVESGFVGAVAGWAVVADRASGALTGHGKTPPTVSVQELSVASSKRA